MKILVADDNADAADTLALLLRMYGHVTTVARDGGEAVTACAEFQPDVALLDIGMPVMDGYQVARRLRDDTASAGVLLAAITGWGQSADKRRAHEAGFDLHFTKPVDLDQLLAALAAGRAA
ncbi:MAG TPA: response regulator [Gemmatimonadaceae bacterium]|nr:response regulator [Gemmatimonadaceae bacterium]